MTPFTLSELQTSYLFRDCPFCKLNSTFELFNDNIQGSLKSFVLSSKEHLHCFKVHHKAISVLDFQVQESCSDVSARYHVSSWFNFILVRLSKKFYISMIKLNTYLDSEGLIFECIKISSKIQLFF
ncbi:hypothetical protein E2C01_021062 [Portunus trituberculatus]|uniref:Uncharacterized protein n=1 Tax=Portunus trituberculatus TaxID=210409 RepID=A0A5B7E1N4_PORTR|nr:hypothetical protein [Portunus trituberculatus]